MDDILMKFNDLKITKGLIRLVLTPDMCKKIAAGLYLASQYGPSDETDTWATLAMMFQACAEAGDAQTFTRWDENGKPLDLHIEKTQNGAIMGVDHDDA